MHDDDEALGWDDGSEFDGPEDDESLVNAWKDVPIDDLLQDISDDIRELVS